MTKEGLNMKLNFLIILFFIITNASGLTLRQSVEETMITNPDILALQKKQDAFKKYVDEENGDYFPKINIGLRAN